MAWDKDQVRLFVKHVKARVGTTWAMVGPELREGLLAAEFASVIVNQHVSTLKTADVVELWLAMRREAGLL